MVKTCSIKKGHCIKELDWTCNMQGKMKRKCKTQMWCLNMFEDECKDSCIPKKLTVLIILYLANSKDK